MRYFLLNIVVFVVIELTSCCAVKAPTSYAHDLSELKCDLRRAQKELSVAQTRVIKLEEAIAQREISQIKEEIGKIEVGEAAELLHSRQQRLAFFSDQREILAAIIHNHPVCASQAQAVLDQILTLITHVSDEIVD